MTSQLSDKIEVGTLDEQVERLGKSVAKKNGEQETYRRYVENKFVSEIPEDPPLTNVEDEEVVEPETQVAISEEIKPLSPDEAHLQGLHNSIDKRREEMRRQFETSRSGSQAEANSGILTQRVEWVYLEHILRDPKFVNHRVEPTEDEIKLLMESVRREGLKVPVIVVAISPDQPGYYLRAGFRRVMVARRLGWTRIPAIVLPLNTPLIEEHWTNIIENSAHSRLHSYELAHAAKYMRDKFRVRPAEFAARSGYDEKHIYNLLRCIDRLPDAVVSEWRAKAPIPVRYLTKWAAMTPDEAVKMMLVYAGHNPTVVKEWRPAVAGQRQRPTIAKSASASGLQRMQRLRFALHGTAGLDSATRDLCLMVVDFCSGAREDLPGIYNPREKKPRYKAGAETEIEMIDLDEVAPSPPESSADIQSALTETTNTR